MRTDDELLEAWRTGDSDAGEELFERHFDAIARFFSNKANDAVEDLIQKTFLACVESRDRFRGESSFRTFLFSVAYNVLHKHYRTKRRHGDKIDFGVTSVHDLAPSPSNVVAKHHEQRLLLEALRHIPLEFQIVLELSFWEHLSAREIGQVLGIPEGTAKTRLRRAKRLLEEEMEHLAASPEQLRNTMQDLDGWARGLREHLVRPEGA